MSQRCEKWEKGEDCSWNQRTARQVLVPVLVIILAFSVWVLALVKKKNSSWLARPVVCLVCVMISLSCDIVEHIFVLSELREHGHEWYANSSIDSLGDISLMYSLYLFAGIWCDCIRVALSTSEGFFEDVFKDLVLIRKLYLGVLVVTTPMAILFSLGSITHHYDSYMMLYMLGGIFTGLMLLTPATYLMHRTVHRLPEEVKDQPLYKQLVYMVKVKVAEQVVWNFLIFLAVVTILLYLQGRGKSAFQIGTASVSISICWIIVHLQVVIFFATVRSAGASNPVFNHSMLESLMKNATSPKEVRTDVNADRDHLELADIQTSISESHVV